MFIPLYSSSIFMLLGFLFALYFVTSTKFINMPIWFIFSVVSLLSTLLYTNFTLFSGVVGLLFYIGGIFLLYLWNINWLLYLNFHKPHYILWSWAYFSCIISTSWVVYIVYISPNSLYSFFFFSGILCLMVGFLFIMMYLINSFLK